MATAGENSRGTNPAAVGDFEWGALSGSPEAQVEAFLEAYGELFANVPARWGEVKQIQREEYSPTYVAFAAEGQQFVNSRNQEANNLRLTLNGQAGQTAHSTRYMSRHGAGQINMSLANSLDELCGEATRLFRTYIQPQPELSDTDVVQVAMERNAEEGKRFQVDPELQNAHTATLVSQINEAISSLTIAYILAHHTQHRAILAIQEVLANDNTVLPLLEKVTALAEDQQSEDRVSVGLLETLATYLAQQRGGSNAIREAIDRVITPESLRGEFAANFIRNYTDQGPKRKRQAAEVAGMQLLLRVITEDYGHPFEELTEQVAARFADYGDLQAALTGHTTKTANNYWKTVLETLKPYEKSGRVLLAPRPSLEEELAALQGKPTNIFLSEAKRLVKRRKEAAQSQHPGFDVEDI